LLFPDRSFIFTEVMLLLLVFGSKTKLSVEGTGKNFGINFFSILHMALVVTASASSSQHMPGHL
jgi:hypothetical protein